MLNKLNGHVGIALCSCVPRHRILGKCSSFGITVDQLNAGLFLYKLVNIRRLFLNMEFLHCGKNCILLIGES